MRATLLARSPANETGYIKIKTYSQANGIDLFSLSLLVVLSSPSPPLSCFCLPLPSSVYSCLYLSLYPSLPSTIFFLISLSQYLVMLLLICCRWISLSAWMKNFYDYSCLASGNGLIFILPNFHMCLHIS